MALGWVHLDAKYHNSILHLYLHVLLSQAEAFHRVAWVHQPSDRRSSSLTNGVQKTVGQDHAVPGLQRVTLCGQICGQIDWVVAD